jgi:hypothetical protein
MRLLMRHCLSAWKFATIIACIKDFSGLNQAFAKWVFENIVLGQSTSCTSKTTSNISKLKWKVSTSTQETQEFPIGHQ